MVKQRGLTSILASGALFLGVFGLTACASKPYVSEEIAKSSAATDKRINDVESQVEATQTKVKAHDTKLTELDSATRQALERAQQAGKLAEGKFVYSLVLSDDAAKFPVNKYELSPEAQEQLNALPRGSRRRTRTSTWRSRATPIRPARTTTTSSWARRGPRRFAATSTSRA